MLLFHSSTAVRRVPCTSSTGRRGPIGAARASRFAERRSAQPYYYILVVLLPRTSTVLYSIGHACALFKAKFDGCSSTGRPPSSALTLDGSRGGHLAGLSWCSEALPSPSTNQQTSASAMPKKSNNDKKKDAAAAGKSTKPPLRVVLPPRSRAPHTKASCRRWPREILTSTTFSHAQSRR